MIRFFFPICFLFLLVTSCGKKLNLSKEKKTTDSLKSELVKIASDFSRLDSSKITAAASEIKDYFNFINPRIKDTITRDEAAALSEFKNISKAFGKYIRTKKELARYYKFNLKQLEDLSFDMENGNIDVRDSALKYLNQEIKANQQLMTMMKLHNQIIPQKLKRYDSLVPVVMEFARKISKGENTPLIFSKGKPTNSSIEEDD
jgi:hypothetical protein